MARTAGREKNCRLVINPGIVWRRAFCVTLVSTNATLRRKESGEPYVVLHGKGQTLFAVRGAKQLLVSLSHTENYAAATAVLEG